MLTESSDAKPLSLSILTTLSGHSDIIRSISFMPLLDGEHPNLFDEVDMIVVVRLASASQAFSNHSFL